MATRPVFTVTAAPQEIVAALALTDGAYTLQNIGTEPIIFSLRDAAPADLSALIADKGHILSASRFSGAPADTKSTVRITVEGDLVYVWTAGADGELVLSDA